MMLLNICPKCGIGFDREATMDYCPMCSPILNSHVGGDMLYCFRCKGTFTEQEAISCGDIYHCPVCAQKLHLSENKSEVHSDYTIVLGGCENPEFCKKCRRCKW